MKWRVAGVLLAVLIGFVVFATPSSAQEATVKRVIDGDTIDVVTDDGTERIRLLNVDTPETKDPSKGQECLGQEATTFTESILQPGDSVELEFDRERRDRYGRTLAHLKLDDGRYASELIAAQGLGDAVVYGKNDRRFKQVKEALITASENERGFFDPAMKCTLAAQNKAATAQVASISEVDSGVTAAQAVAAVAALAVIKKALGKIDSTASDATWIGRRVYVTVGRVTETAAVSDARTSVTTAMLDLKVESKERKKVEVKKAKAKKVKAKKAAKAAARRAADAQAARDAAAQADSGGSGSSGGGPSGSSGSYPGYTGPRCYAPGGKTWKPC